MPWENVHIGPSQAVHDLGSGSQIWGTSVVSGFQHDCCAYCSRLFLKHKVRTTIPNSWSC